ncbi:hypothetical protein K1X76_10765 [bacterium]|nr:hypothetical protein [bacterium]
MNRKILFLFFTLIALALGVACSRQDSPSPGTANGAVHEDASGYWTCPMHPQVHQHEKGKCPICGMDLVHVEAKKEIQKSPETSEAPNPRDVHITNQQMNLALIGRYTVSRQDLDISIPVSGSIQSLKEVILQIYESDLALVKTGADFSGFASSAPQTVLKGKITGVDSLVDPSTRTLKALGTVDGTAQNIPMYGGFQGKITVRLKDQIVIPAEAVLHTGTRDLVYLVTSDNHLNPQPVVLGSKSTEEYQVFAGLEAGEVISSGPNFLIDSESKIRGTND